MPHLVEYRNGPKKICVGAAVSSNYEIKRTPDVTLRTNNHWQRAPLISALDPAKGIEEN